ncbi:MAG: CapA family protein, partial [Cyclobacteriaceae bacterium]|nr:CapA family protein [Cyclobacteriaceae bacterium]
MPRKIFRYLFLLLVLYNTTLSAQEKTSYSVIGVGDIMMGTNYPDKSYLPPNNGKGLLSEVKDILLEADLTFGNLEGVILDEGGTAKNCNDPKTCFVFRSPESYLQNLIEAGFDVLSTANNHVNDFGTAGRKNTASALDRTTLQYAGFADKPSVTFSKGNIKYGFAAFAPNAGTADLYDIESAKSIVNKLNKECDIVIVSFHAGAEGKNHQHVTK